MSRGGKGYVSDEVWYVGSSRVILNKVFKIEPRINASRLGLTVVFRNATLREVEDLIKQYRLNVTIIDSRYTRIKAIYVESSSRRELEVFLKLMESKGWLIDSIWGWRMPDHVNINNYFNLEHPPLVKYIIGLSITLLGDRPISWRIPSIIAGLLTNLFVFLSVYKLCGNPWAGLIASLFTGLDPLMRALSSIALLDVYVALWTVVSMYLLFSGRPYLSLVAVAIGSLFKFNVLFCAIPTLIYLFTRSLKNQGSLKRGVINLTYGLMLLSTLFLSLQVLASTPLISYFGLEDWFYNSIVSAIKWHITIKCVKPPCPVSSEPWDWFIGRNGFVLYYFDQRTSLVALGFQPLWIYALTITLYSTPISRRIKEVYFANLYLLGVLLGYVALWLVGNKQQYSFYAVQLTPLVYVCLVINTYLLVLKPENIRLNNNLWLKALRKTMDSALMVIKPEFN